MMSKSATAQPDLIQITPLPQHVPSSACFQCDVCCRFPDADSFLRPYFTSDEIRQAISRGVHATHFPNQSGGQVQLVPNPTGEGYLCPAFDPQTSHCRIYDVRPLDCQIYPLAVMRSADDAETVLGWDTKCPFLQRDTNHEEHGTEPTRADQQISMDTHAEKIASLLERDLLEIYANNSKLIGKFQDDVMIARSLPRLTQRGMTTSRDFHTSPLQVDTFSAQSGSAKIGPVRFRPPGFGRVQALSFPRDASRHGFLTPGVLHPLSLSDRSHVERAMIEMETPLSAYSFAPHVMWRELFSYTWCKMAEHLCIFAAYEDGLYMPLPPLGRGSLAEPLAQAFALMHDRNGGSSVTRIENVPEELTPTFESLGYLVVSKDAEYLYSASDLINLSGDRYKSQRAACNRFIRTHKTRLELYQETDREECLALFEAWRVQQEACGSDTLARHLLRDAKSAHRQALTLHGAIGLIGRVVRVDGIIRAYTFGYARSSSVFCVALEVADRSVTGLAQYVFREFCREAAERGHRFINTMDDSGLERLRLSKQAYRPRRLVQNYIAVDPVIRQQITYAH